MGRIILAKNDLIANCPTKHSRLMNGLKGLKALVRILKAILKSLLMTIEDPQICCNLLLPPSVSLPPEVYAYATKVICWGVIVSTSQGRN